jgi:hypothetical protein
MGDDPDQAPGLPIRIRLQGCYWDLDKAPGVLIRALIKVQGAD